MGIWSENHNPWYNTYGVLLTRPVFIITLPIVLFSTFVYLPMVLFYPTLIPMVLHIILIVYITMVSFLFDLILDVPMWLYIYVVYTHGAQSSFIYEKYLPGLHSWFTSYL